MLGGPWVSWQAATERALYAEHGFYRHERQPARHFRTSALSTVYIAALVALLGRVDEALGRPRPLDVVDVGAGGGELLDGIARLAPRPHRLRLTAVEIAPRPAGLDPRIGWTSTIPDGITGLVVANEWLDNVPVDVVEQTADGPRTVLVEPRTGDERTGGPPGAADLAWLDRWWPLTAVGTRAEPGRPRDEAWAGLIRALDRGLAVAADYTHLKTGRPACGSLAAYRDGRQVFPVPNGSCDVTAHVAIDACAAAGVQAGADDTLLTTQRAALRGLGVRGERPPVSLAGADPRDYLRGLCRAGQEAELIDRSGLGGFGWLVQAVGVDVPAVLRAEEVR
jgi:SAM-dependent MidA family methyltransferase